MQVRVLGGYGSDFCSVQKQGGKKRYNPTGFLINQSVILDAGTICGALTLSELTTIRYVFLTHAHLDHVQGLAYLAEALFDKIHQPVTVVAHKEAIGTLREHFFNDKLWPDFTCLPSKKAPILSYQILESGKSIKLEGLTVTPIAVHHIVPAVGFIIQDSQAGIVFSGDTYKTEAIWGRAKQTSRLKAAFIECSFPNGFEKLAYDSGHLVPRLAYQEFLKIKRSVPLYLYHMKPRYLEKIQAEVSALGSREVYLLDDGQTLEF